MFRLGVAIGAALAYLATAFFRGASQQDGEFTPDDPQLLWIRIYSR